MQGSESVLIVAFNASLKHYGGDLAVGAMTIVSSITQVRTMILQGVAQGAQPILGYNYGAGNSDGCERPSCLALTAPCCYRFPVADRVFVPHLLCTPVQQ